MQHWGLLDQSHVMHRLLQQLFLLLSHGVVVLQVQPSKPFELNGRRPAVGATAAGHRRTAARAAASGE